MPMVPGNTRVDPRSAGIPVVERPAWPSAIVPIAIAIAGAWLVAIVAQATGNAVLLHHHTLIEGGPPLWIGVPLFLVGWQVMVAAMMLPASLPTIRYFTGATAGLTGAGLAQAGFLLAFAGVWTGFGLAAFAGDLALHRVVDATPWLAGRPWLVEASVLALAGAYQFAPLKRRSLAACRHPAEFVARAVTGPWSGFHVGLDHGRACLGSSWALMLLMFAEGFANLWWMVGLTAIMVFETAVRRERWLASTVGVILLTFAVTALASGLGVA